MLLHGSVSTAQIAAADALILYVSQSVREHLLGVISFMVFLAHILQKVVFVFVSLKLNHESNTSVVITERLSEFKGVREIVCVPICSSLFHCAGVSVCFCAGAWLAVTMCI